MPQGQPSGPPHDRPRRAVRCAWCGRLFRGGRWVGDRSASAHEVDVQAHRSRSHGICPDCFAELAPGVPYPATWRDDEGGDEPA